MLRFGRGITLIVVGVVFSVSCFGADKIQPQELVAKHLQAIGSDSARATVQSREVAGSVRMSVLAGGAGQMDGAVKVLSAGDTVDIRMTFPDPNYKEEDFRFDGKKVNIGQIRPGVKSRLGILLESESNLVEEGLLGGVLSTAWPLLNPSEKRLKLSSDGLKNIDGKSLYQVTYKPHKRGDMEIKLYFEPDTFRHVMSVYTMTVSPRMGSNEIENARQQASHFRLEEHFGNFKEEDGLTLPTSWTMKLTSDGTLSGTFTQQSTSVLEWQMDLQKFSNGTATEGK